MSPRNDYYLGLELEQSQTDFHHKDTSTEFLNLAFVELQTKPVWTLSLRLSHVATSAQDPFGETPLFHFGQLGDETAHSPRCTKSIASSFLIMT